MFPPPHFPRFHASMKRLPAFFWLGLLLCTLLPLSSWALSERQRQLIAERIAPVGSVCLSDQPCASQVAKSSARSGLARSGEQVYESSCFACHQMGVNNAPLFGDADAWRKLLAKSEETLYKHVWDGYNAMPPRGACVDCSEEEIRLALEYMITAVR